VVGLTSVVDGGQFFLVSFLFLKQTEPHCFHFCMQGGTAGSAVVRLH